MKNVLIISSSLRKNSNSEMLAKAFAEGAEKAGNNVETISLRDKNIGFCIGCLSCQNTLKCVINDDAVSIAEKMKNSDVLVFATPIYYYEMAGQLKVLLDRMNPLYSSDYKFREVYVLSTAAEDEESVPDRAVNGICGWIDCFEKASLAGSLFCGGVTSPAEIKGNKALEKAFEMGERI